MEGSSVGKIRSGRAGGGSTRNSPGNRKVAGETLCVVLMPLHPAPSDKTAPHIANRAIFQFNLTTRQV
jgi:hypothetical protein